jgi:hypothetical protein
MPCHLLLGMLRNDWRKRSDWSSPIIGSILELASENNRFHFFANGKLSNFRVCSTVRKVREKVCQPTYAGAI